MTKQNNPAEYTEKLPGGASFTMKLVEGGAFMMGSDEFKGTVPTFYMCEHLVTQDVWRAIMGNNPSNFKWAQQNPVEQVSWYDVQAFITKLNAWEQQNPNPNRPAGYYCLPSEAQWEYAARGGNKSRGYKYAGSNDIDKVAWHRFNSGNRTHPVGQKQPNELGLYDMSGNVWEWTQDKWGKNYLDAPTDGSAWQGNTEYDARVVRGGSWNLFPNGCRVSSRYRLDVDLAFSNIGCRLAFRDWYLVNYDNSSIGCRLAHTIYF